MSTRRPRRRKPSNATGRQCTRLLFTCIGRRVELMRAFRRAAEVLKIKLEIHGADAARLSPGIHLVDQAHILPPIASGRYIDALTRVVRRAEIDLLIPLLDLELQVLAEAVERFAEWGCRVLVSSESVVRICRDKLATYQTLKAAGIDTPATWSWSQALSRKRHRFPYFLKPRCGSAGMGNYVVRNAQELRAFGRSVPDAIVQEFVEGVEYTLDVYTGLDGRTRCVVPRRRLEVRGGEVSKALVVKDRSLMAIGRRVVDALGPCRGVITVQCIRTPRSRIRVIEINPRFGGGVPLAIHAGADFARWILAEHLGRKPRIDPLGFRGNIAMLRFDDSVFVPNVSTRGKVE